MWQPQGHDIPDPSDFVLSLCVLAHACAHNGGFTLALFASRLAVSQYGRVILLLKPHWHLVHLCCPFAPLLSSVLLPTEAFSSANIANLCVSRVSFSPYLHPSQTPGSLSSGTSLLIASSSSRCKRMRGKTTKAVSFRKYQRTSFLLSFCLDSFLSFRLLDSKIVRWGPDLGKRRKEDNEIVCGFVVKATFW